MGGQMKQKVTQRTGMPDAVAANMRQVIYGVAMILLIRLAKLSLILATLTPRSMALRRKPVPALPVANNEATKKQPPPRAIPTAWGYASTL